MSEIIKKNYLVSITMHWESAIQTRLFTVWVRILEAGEHPMVYGQTHDYICV